METFCQTCGRGQTSRKIYDKLIQKDQKLIELLIDEPTRKDNRPIRLNPEKSEEMKSQKLH